MRWLLLNLDDDGTRPTSRGLGTGSDYQLEKSCGTGTLVVPWWFPGGWWLAAAYCQAGDYERGQEQARKLADSHSHTCGAALYYAATGEVDAMFDALEGAYRQRDRILIDIKNLPFFERYRSDPRFADLLRRMNLQP